MPRQPLRSKFSNVTGFSIGGGNLADRPAMAAAIMKCIALWSDVEHQQAMILAKLLSADTPATIALYLSITQGFNRRRAVFAAASAVLGDREMELLKAIWAIGESIASQRNDLAHGIFGKCDEIPDGVLWLPAKHWGALSLEMNRAAEDVKQRALDSGPRTPAHIYGQLHVDMARMFRAIVDKLFIYMPADISDLEAQLRAHVGHLESFLFILNAADAFVGTSRRRRNLSDLVYQQLILSPPIQEALSRLRARNTTSDNELHSQSDD